MDQLFGSKTRVKLLQLFMANPNRAFYVREITRKIEEQINSVRRELANLLSIGILTSKNKDNRLYYEVDQDFEQYRALRALFAGGGLSGDKTDATSGTDDELTSSLKGLGSVDLLLYTGEFTGDNRSGTDVLIVGNVNKTNVNNFIADLEDTEGREIRYSIMTLDEFNYRRSIRDRFVSLIEESRKTVLHDPSGIMSDEKQAQDKTKAKSKKKGK